MHSEFLFVLHSTLFVISCSFLFHPTTIVAQKLLLKQQAKRFFVIQRVIERRTSSSSNTHMPVKISKSIAGPSSKPAGTTSKPPGGHAKKSVKIKVKKVTTNAPKKAKGKKKPMKPRQRILGVVENFVVVWLDSHISPTNRDCRNSITGLHHIVNSISTYTEVDECLTFLQQIQDEKVFLIVSGSLGEQIVPIVQNFHQLNFVYVFCSNRAKHELWASQYSNIRGIFTEIQPLCETLQHDIRQCENNLMPITVLSRSECSARALNSLEPSFMYSKLLQEILIDFEQDKEAKTDFIKFCVTQYADNRKELVIIDEFRRNYTPSMAIQWYTRECFTYNMLNKALRTQDIEIILRMGFLVRDLHQQIAKLHVNAEKHCRPFTVYRGQAMTNHEFNRLISCRGGLLSFNNFLSTTTDSRIALKFAHHSSRTPNTACIFFQMEIDPTISSTPFTSVRDVGCFRDREKEILFSMHTVFRIEGFERLEDGIHKVLLKLTDDNDEQLCALTNHMRNETSGSTGWHRLGALMIVMGQFDKADEFYTTALATTPHDNWEELVHIHRQLGRANDEKGDSETALDHYQEALDIQLTHLPSDDYSFAMTYSGIGSVLYSRHDLETASEYFQHALEITRKNSEPDPLEVATIHNHIGQVLDEQGKYIEALHSYQQSLEIRKRNLPSGHPSLAATFNNIGLLYQSMNDHTRAFDYLKETLEIEQKSLPPNHPSLAVTHHNTSQVLERLCRYQEAVDHQMRAVEILRATHGPVHPDVQREEDDLERIRAKL